MFVDEEEMLAGVDSILCLTNSGKLANQLTLLSCRFPNDRLLVSNWEILLLTKETDGVQGWLVAAPIFWRI